MDLDQCSPSSPLVMDLGQCSPTETTECSSSPSSSERSTLSPEDNPLLGSPSHYGFWAPKNLSPSRSVSAGSISEQTHSPRYNEKVKNMPEEEAAVVYTLLGIRDRLDEQILETKKTRLHLIKVAGSLQKLVRRTDRMLRLATNLRQDLADVAYLEQILNFLNGNLDPTSLTNWPFRFAEQSGKEMNLVI